MQHDRTDEIIEAGVKKFAEDHGRPYYSERVDRAKSEVKNDKVYLINKIGHALAEYRLDQLKISPKEELTKIKTIDASSTVVNHEPVQQYGEFQRRREILVSLIQRLRGLLASLDMTDTENTLKQLLDLVQSESFKVLVLGEFKVGKSTFINAMLGEEILPAYAKPCTAIINEVKWGETRRALLHFSKSNYDQPRSPEEIDLKELEEYIVIKNDVNELHENHYHKVELFWPLLLCKNGVEIIDSPGLNEHDIRQKISIDYLSCADAVLFVLSCEALASTTELDVIDKLLKPAGHKDIFFICNRFNMIRDNEKSDIKERGISRLAERTRGEERVFFVSAVDGLEGRKENDVEKVIKSGILKVEEELEKFLTTERARIKILRPAREIQVAISKARRVIPARESMLKTDLTILEERFEDAQEPLLRLEAERDRIIKRIAKFSEDRMIEISSNACRFFVSLSSQCTEWVEWMDLKNSINFLSLEGTPTQVESLVKEIDTFLTEKVQSEFLNWQNDTLRPLLEARLHGLFEEMEEDVSNFINEIDTIRLQVSGSVVSIDGDDVGPRKVSAMERVLTVAASFWSPCSAGLGAVFGYEEMAKSLLPQFGLAALGYTISLFLIPFLPAAATVFVCLGLMAGGGFLQGKQAIESIIHKIKDEVSKRFAASLRDSAQQYGNEVAEGVMPQLIKIRNGVEQSLNQEIQSTVDQINSARTEMQKGQANVDQKLQQLSSLERELEIIDEELRNLMMQFD